ncbi:uncharacterized protein RSE6_01656 [Rhynchosporium secalis]|uniref:Uncharacterized protein n=1 Tax=Rhynchosporium secalis TaxID=38038 RepID=A0A1E1LZY8_RHYSE|nr:uncharacterized protein RSE6_01656 [Rhynchosporium secalis]
MLILSYLTLQYCTVPYLVQYSTYIHNIEVALVGTTVLGHETNEGHLEECYHRSFGRFIRYFYLPPYHMSLPIMSSKATPESRRHNPTSTLDLVLVLVLVLVLLPSSPRHSGIRAAKAKRNFQWHRILLR